MSGRFRGLPKMRIGLNLLHSHPGTGGARNYAANLLLALALREDDCQYVAYCTPQSADLVPDDRRFQVRLVRLLNRSRGERILYEQSLLPFLFYRDKVDCVHWFANNMPLLHLTPSIVTLHDFKFADRPSESSFAKSHYQHWMARWVCRNADMLAPISESTAQDAVERFGANPRRITVVPNALGNSFQPLPAKEVDEFRRRFQLPSKFWLYVAHAYSHKNHARLFAAYRKHLQSTCNWPLVLRADTVPGEPPLEKIATELGIADSIIWLPRLSWEDMPRLYCAASALIFPSLYEGCGIPVLEAMACGCPVAAARIRATQEFAGDAAWMFNPESIDEIALVMDRFVSDPLKRRVFAERGLKRAARYSAPSVGEKLFALYRRTVQNGIHLSRSSELN